MRLREPLRQVVRSPIKKTMRKSVFERLGTVARAEPKQSLSRANGQQQVTVTFPSLSLSRNARRNRNKRMHLAARKKVFESLGAVPRAAPEQSLNKANDQQQVTVTFPSLSMSKNAMRNRNKRMHLAAWKKVTSSLPIGNSFSTMDTIQEEDIVSQKRRETPQAMARPRSPLQEEIKKAESSRPSICKRQKATIDRVHTRGLNPQTQAIIDRVHTRGLYPQTQQEARRAILQVREGRADDVRPRHNILHRKMNPSVFNRSVPEHKIGIDDCWRYSSGNFHDFCFRTSRCQGFH